MLGRLRPECLAGVNEPPLSLDAKSGGSPDRLREASDAEDRAERHDRDSPTAADRRLPLSLAFGTGNGRPRRSAFVTNFAIPPRGGAGPGIVQVRIGIRGQPLP